MSALAQSDHLNRPGGAPAIRFNTSCWGTIGLECHMRWLVTTHLLPGPAIRWSPPEADMDSGPSNPADLVTRRELWSWYLYDWANSAYMVVITCFNCQAACRTFCVRAARPCTDDADALVPAPSSNATAIMMDSPYTITPIASYTCLKCEPGLGSQVVDGSGVIVSDPPDLYVNAGAVQLRPATFALLCVSSSVALQAVSFVVFGALGDQGRWRKCLMIGCMIGGMMLALMFVAIPVTADGDMWWLPGLLLVAGNVLYGLAGVYYISYLPVLSRLHPDAQEPENADAAVSLSQLPCPDGNPVERIQVIPNNAHVPSGTDCNSVDVQVLQRSGRPDLSRLDRVQNGISMIGVVFSFAGSLAALVVCFFVLYFLGALDTDDELRTIRGYKHRQEQNPPLGLGKSVVQGWRQLRRTVVHVKQYKHTLRFLALFFFYSDGLSTVPTYVLLVSQTEVCVKPLEQVLFGAEMFVCAVLGSGFFLHIHRRLKIPNKTMVMIHLLLCTVVPIWGLLGFFSSDIGYRSSWELHLDAAYAGFNVGPLISFSRTTLSNLTPVGCEAEFFSFMMITDKGSSWMGPLVTALLNQFQQSSCTSLSMWRKEGECAQDCQETLL
eukprot:gene7581-1356_t